MSADPPIAENENPSRWPTTRSRIRAISTPCSTACGTNRHRATCLPAIVSVSLVTDVGWVVRTTANRSRRHGRRRDPRRHAHRRGRDQPVRARDARHPAATTAVDTTYLKDVVGFYPFDLAAGAADGQPIREEVRIGERVLHSVVTPLREDGEPIGAIVVLRDLGDTADVARRRAEFAQVMSHELRTPLTSIAGALDIVLSGYAGPLTDRQLRYVDMARQAATRMNQLVDQLLDLARAQAGSITVAAAPVQLDRLAREVIDRYRAAAATKQLTIVLGASADDISILGDPERLAQVLGNLLTNAIRFAPASGVIDVQVFGPPLSEDAVGVSVAQLRRADRARGSRAHLRAVLGVEPARRRHRARPVDLAHDHRGARRPDLGRVGRRRHEVRVHAAGLARRPRRPIQLPSALDARRAAAASARTRARSSSTTIRAARCCSRAC